MSPAVTASGMSGIWMPVASIGKFAKGSFENQSADCSDCSSMLSAFSDFSYGYLLWLRYVICEWSVECRPGV